MTKPTSSPGHHKNLTDKATSRRKDKYSHKSHSKIVLELLSNVFYELWGWP